MSARTSTKPERRVDLSVPDSSNLDRACPLWKEVLWYLIGSRIVESRLLPVSAIKVRTLRLFGAQIGGNVYLKPGIRIKFPWKLRIGDYSWIGEDAWIDNLDWVTIGAHCCVSQGSYFCTGNHDWSARNMKLFTRPIEMGDGSWVGAKSIVCPGVTIAQGAIAQAGSVVTKSIGPDEIHGGNPAQFYKRRRVRG